MGSVKYFLSLLICCIYVISCGYAQHRVLYGLPPLPDDTDLIRTTTTLAPIRHHMLPHLMFTLPPMTPLPALVNIGPYAVNPIPELPPIPESRLDGKYDNDGNFVPNSTPKPEKQIAENRIHGVKIEPFAVPNYFRQPQSDPPRSYPNVRGVEIVTISPLLHSSVDDFEDDEPAKAQGVKNARQWQTTATKIVTKDTAIEPGTLTGDIESIDKIIETHGDRDHDSESGRIHRPQVVQPIGTTRSPRREIFTTRLLVGALGMNEGSTPLPLQAQRRHRLQHNVVKPQQRRVKPQRPQGHQPFFDYRPKQRTFVPEQKVVTKPPQIRPRIVPNRPAPSFIPQTQRALPPIQMPQPAHPIILPPQPYGRDPQDAAFLQEVEEYDWRLHYKQQSLQHSPPTASQLRGFNRAQGEVQTPGNARDTDYEDLVAIRNREYFTDNPPQKSLPIPTTTEASEVLIPFNNAQSQISNSNLRTAAASSSSQSSSSSANNNGIPNTGGFIPQNNIFNQGNNFGAVTPSPIFGGLFNLFNQQGGGLFNLPGFGR